MAASSAHVAARVSRAATVVLALLALLVLAATPARAHPAVVGSSPADGAHLDRAPTEVSITFGEGVEAPLGSVKVFDRESRRVDLEDARLVGDDRRTAVVSLPPDLPDGWYLVIWRAIGLEDGHLVIGQQQFVVGDDAAGAVGDDAAGAVGDDAAGAVGDDAAGAVGDDAAGDAVGDAAALAAAVDAGGDLGAYSALGRVVSATSTVATVVAAGVAAFALGVLRRRDGRWRPARLALTRVVHRASVAVCALGVVAVLVEAAARAAAFGTPLTVATVGAAVVSPVGTAALARTLLLLPLATRSLLGVRWYVLAATGLAVATLALDGHVGGGGVAAAVVHVLVVAGWGGGLVGLLVTVRTAPTDDAHGLAATLGRFSSLAAGTVVVAGLAGALVATLTTDAGIAAAAESPWGRALTAKTAVVVASLLVAAHTRTVVMPRLRETLAPVPQGAAVDVVVTPAATVASTPAIAVLRRNLTVEAVLVATVFATSGVLGTLAPPVEGSGAPAPAPVDCEAARGSVGELAGIAHEDDPCADDAGVEPT